MKQIIVWFIVVLGIAFNQTSSYFSKHIPDTVSGDIDLDSQVEMLNFNSSYFGALNTKGARETNIGYSKTRLTKVQPVVKASSVELETEFQLYGSEYGVSPEVLRIISYCESTHNPMATNHIYAGLYQFSPSTWQSTRNQMGLDPNPDLRFDPSEAIKTAAFKISRGGIGAWPTCGQRIAQA